MNKREAAVIGAYTGILLGDMSELHAYVEEIMGRGVMTHELASKRVTKQIKEKAKPELLSICRGITNE